MAIIPSTHKSQVLSPKSSVLKSEKNKVVIYLMAQTE